MIRFARAMAGAALLRTESRGAHYREDYPELDDKNWLQNIVIHHSANQDALAFESVMKAFKGEGDRSSACEQAAGIPAQVIGICLTHVECLVYLSAQGNPNLITDTAIASLLFDSALKSSELNILINMKDFDAIPEVLESAINSVPGATNRLQFIASTIRTGLS